MFCKTTSSSILDSEDPIDIIEAFRHQCKGDKTLYLNFEEMVVDDLLIDSLYSLAVCFDGRSWEQISEIARVLQV